MTFEDTSGTASIHGSVRKPLADARRNVTSSGYLKGTVDEHLKVRKNTSLELTTSITTTVQAASTSNLIPSERGLSSIKICHESGTTKVKAEKTKSGKEMYTIICHVAKINPPDFSDISIF